MKFFLFVKNFICKFFVAGHFKNELSRFIVAGLINTIINLGIFSAGVYVLGLNYGWALAISLSASILAGYWQSKNKVFQKGVGFSLWRYLSVWLFIYVISYVAIGKLINMGITEVIAFVLNIPVSVVLSFVLQKYWVVKHIE